LENSLDQASMTASTYMGEAKRHIDQEFGDHFAIQHPELVAAFMQTAASDFQSCSIAVAADKLSDAIRSL
jgi:hypothetical protein